MFKKSSRAGLKAAATLRGDKYYETGKPCKWGHISKRYTKTGSCVQCDYERGKEYTRKNPDKKRQYAKRDYIKNRKTYDNWYKANRKSQIEKCANWRKNNKERHLEMVKSWAKRNPLHVRALRARRYKRVKTATLPGTDMKMIDRIYMLRPDGYHVDHKVPLKGKNSKGQHVICGLHTPKNLQYLPSAANLTKQSRWSETESADSCSIVPFSWEHFLVISEQA